MTDHYLSTEDHDASRWFAVPAQWPVPGFEKELPDIAAWADVAARAAWNSSPLTARPDELDELAGILAFAVERFPTVYPGFEVLLHLPGPRHNPIPVYVGDVEATDDDPESALRYGTAADDPNAVESPIVEELHSPHLGRGIRVLRYSTESDGGILAGLRYGWYIEELGLETYVFTASPDTGRLLGAMDDIDALARCIRYEAE